MKTEFNKDFKDEFRQQVQELWNSSCQQAQTEWINDMLENMSFSLSQRRIGDTDQFNTVIIVENNYSDGSDDDTKETHQTLSGIVDDLIWIEHDAEDLTAIADELIVQAERIKRAAKLIKDNPKPAIDDNYDEFD